MADISKIELPNGSIYNIKDDYINPYVEHTNTSTLEKTSLYLTQSGGDGTHFTFSNTLSNGDYLKDITLDIAYENVLKVERSTLTQQINTYIGGQGKELYLGSTDPVNGSITHLRGQATVDYQLYLKDWRTGGVTNNYSVIAAYSADSDLTRTNIYYVSNGYHAFYTNNNGYYPEGSSSSSSSDAGHAKQEAAPFYIFNDHMRANVPIRFNENYGKNAASETFIDAESGWLGYTGSYDASGASNNSIKEGTVTVSKANYYPIALSGFQTKTRMLVPVRIAITSRSVGSCTIGYSIANRHTSSINVSDGSFKVWLTWVRCS